MEYNIEFIDRCKELFPDAAEFHRALEIGTDYVGEYLHNSWRKNVALNTILEAESLEDLKHLAMTEMEKAKLYVEWCEMRYCC